MKEGENTYLSAFISITKAITSSLDLREVLQMIVKKTCEITGSKGCTLMLLDENGQTLETKSSFGLSNHYIRKGPLFADRSISKTLEGKPIIIEDAAADPRVQYPEEAKQEGIASVVSVPILLRGKTIGALRLYTSIRCKFTEDDLRFISAIAEQSGLAIENARVHESLRALAFR